MKKTIYSFEFSLIFRHLLRWTLIAIPVSAVTGSLVAFFLWSLDLATRFRWQHQWLLYLLPVSGVAVHFLCKLGGKDAERGNNLIIEEIHEPGGGVPVRMTPLVLFTTLITHLFGGSAGREGTAVQMGGSMARLLGKWFRLPKDDLRIIMMMGISAGFGAVFGTPVAGAVFALEVLTIGKIKYTALLPCLIAGVMADIVCTAYGIHHTRYFIFPHPASYLISSVHVDVLMIGKVIFAGIAFGLSGYLFIRLTHYIKAQFDKHTTNDKWLIPVAGGLLIILLTILAGTQDYCGLGVTSADPNGISIVNAFKSGGVSGWSWLWKIAFTAVTIGTGFKGGEVTPLFFIGAALGNTFAALTGSPVDLFAGLGFIAVFAGAANTPMACTIMGAELFGTEYMVYYAIACFTAYYFSGRSGIYSAQRVAVHKSGVSVNEH